MKIDTWQQPLPHGITLSCRGAGERGRPVLLFLHGFPEAAFIWDEVLLHCAAGLGRTGSAAACLLKALGVEANEALQRVREAGSNPQNAEQSGLVHWF